MKLASTLQNQIQNGEHNQRLLDVYVDSALLEYQVKRYYEALQSFINLYGDQEVQIYSAPGRSEVGGNHTDHQHGEVLATAINLDIIAVVAKASAIHIQSDNQVLQTIQPNDLTYKEAEKETSEALVKGVLARMEELGYQIGGFQAYLTSDVLIGSGLSSSAAFEVVMGTIQSELYNKGEVSPVEIGQIGQYAENHYFGKPCGLMDQCASSVGGLIHIDFKDEKHPIVKKVMTNFSQFGYSLCIVDTKGSHADLTNEYASIPKEMKQVAAVFGKEFLREVEEYEFYQRFDEVRAKCKDRAVLRAIHLFEENKRVHLEVQALQEGDFTAFIKNVVASGNSSYKYLQNIYANSDVENQSVSIALARSEMILKEYGVCRVHGGGFAGTIQAFVADDYVQTYQTEIEKIFGKSSCYVLKIRKYGGIQVV